MRDDMIDQTEPRWAIYSHENLAQLGAFTSEEKRQWASPKGKALILNEMEEIEGAFSDRWGQVLSYLFFNCFSSMPVQTPPPWEIGVSAFDIVHAMRLMLSRDLVWRYCCKDAELHYATHLLDCKVKGFCPECAAVKRLFFKPIRSYEGRVEPKFIRWLPKDYSGATAKERGEVHIPETQIHKTVRRLQKKEYRVTGKLTPNIHGS